MGVPIMPGAHQAAPSGPFKDDLVGRAHQFASSARGQIARWLSEFTAYWNRQPLDRFWPPHP
jgi:hypothetical protein